MDFINVHAVIFILEIQKQAWLACFLHLSDQPESALRALSQNNIFFRFYDLMMSWTNLEWTEFLTTSITSRLMDLLEVANIKSLRNNLIYELNLAV